MIVTIEPETATDWAKVFADSEMIGIIDWNFSKNRKYAFRYVDGVWVKLTRTEHLTVEEAVKDVVVLMNVIRQLKG